jgi:glycerol-1-phosphate dehydrogenase [NAD(P)+]
MSGNGIEDGLLASTETDTENVLVGDDTLKSAPDLFGRAFAEQPAVIVADTTTFDVAGRAVHNAMLAAGYQMLEPLVFPGDPTLHADYEHIQALRESLRPAGAIPIAVGSGTVNDIVKRTAYECELRYMSVATAASMDGYTAFGAAITKDGFKLTMKCPAPRAVLADLGILVDAPRPMTASGYADLLAKITAGADWIVADALGIDQIDKTAWALVQTNLRKATRRPSDLGAGDRHAMKDLVDGLVSCGIAMQVTASSRPASGAEHQFSHLWEMEALGIQPETEDELPSHGFKVGLGTLASAALYEELLRCDLSGLDVSSIKAAWPTWGQVEARVRTAHSSSGLADAIVEQSRGKYIDQEALGERLSLLTQRWPELRGRLKEQLLGPGQIRAQLREAGCPTTPSELALTLATLRTTYRRARMIRSRYTVLDLAYETGLFDRCVAKMFSDSGFWGQSERPDRLCGSGSCPERSLPEADPRRSP